MSKKYDYIIVGAGPTGLTLAYYLGKLNKKCLVLEKQESIGGCHRVIRVDGLMTEHSPRIYLDAYRNFINLLKKMDTDFYDLFIEYESSENDIFNKAISQFSFGEIMLLSTEFITLIFTDKNSKNISIGKYMEDNKFSKNIQNLIDRICRITDGSTKDNYTLFQFLQLINQGLLCKKYQPKKPNDKALFKIWQDALNKTNNVDILLNTEVTKINYTKDKIDSITINDKDISAENYILAVPPEPLYELLYNSEKVHESAKLMKLIKKPIEKFTNDNWFFSDLINSFNTFVNPGIFDVIEKSDVIEKLDISGEISIIQSFKNNNLKLWSEQNSYICEIGIIFHWNSEIQLEENTNIFLSEWGIIYIILTNYMDMEEPKSKTVISTVINITDKKSSVLNKTAHECTKNELITETFRQLKYTFPNIPKPTYAILNPLVYRKDDEWEEGDTGYIMSPNPDTKLDSDNLIFNNLYNVGSHNGNCKFYFTSMESAVTNAIYLLHKLEPESKKTVRIYETDNIIDIIRFLFLLSFLLYCFRNVLK